MRLLVSTVLDASAIARDIKAEENSEEMENAIKLIKLSVKLVNIVNERYPIDKEETSIFGIE